MDEFYLYQKYGFKNTEVFPNFRFIDNFTTFPNSTQTLKLVYMARVDKNKGYDTIFNFAKLIKTFAVVIASDNALCEFSFIIPSFVDNLFNRNKKK